MAMFGCGKTKRSFRRVEIFLFSFNSWIGWWLFNFTPFPAKCYDYKIKRVNIATYYMCHY